MANKQIQFFLLLTLLGSSALKAQQKEWKPWVLPEAGKLIAAADFSTDYRLHLGLEKKGLMLG